MSNTDTLPIPEGASERDRQRIEQVNRNLRIRAGYRRLKKRYGWERAMEKLAERHGCSKSTVRKVINGRR